MRELAQAKRHYSKLPLFEFLRAEFDSAARPAGVLSLHGAIHPGVLDLNRSRAARRELQGPASAADQRAHSRGRPPLAVVPRRLRQARLRSPRAVTHTLRSYHAKTTRARTACSGLAPRRSCCTAPHRRKSSSSSEAIEETGNVLFGLTAKIAARIQAEGGPELAVPRPVPFQPGRPGMRCTAHDHRARSHRRSPSSNVCCLDLAFRVFDMFSGLGPPNYWRYAKNALAQPHRPASSSHSCVRHGAL